MFAGQEFVEELHSLIHWNVLVAAIIVASAIFHTSLTDRVEAATIITAVVFVVAVEEVEVVVTREEEEEEILEEVDVVVEGEVLRNNTWHLMAPGRSQRLIIFAALMREEEAARAVLLVGILTI
eukprot:gene24655-27876_t